MPTNLSLETNDMLGKLRKNNSIVDWKLGKGNGVLLIDKAIYVDDMTNLLNGSQNSFHSILSISTWR